MRLAQWAVNLQPMNRSFQALLIRACLDSGNCAKALEYYNDAADLFFRKTGTGVPEEIRTIYQQMLQRVHTSDFDLSMIQEELREADTRLGAFFCDYEVFKNIYRLHARTLLREGRFLYIALVSIVSRDGRQSSGKAAAGCHGGNEGNTDYWPAEGRCGFCVQSQPVCADDAVGRRRDRRPGVEQVEGNLFSELSRFRS